MKRVSEKLKEEVEKKNISGTAYFIAQYLGEGHRNKGNLGEIDEKYKFEDDEFIISTNLVLTSDGGCGMSKEIKFKGRRVFYEGGLDIYTYIPGNWETKLNNLYKKAMETNKKK